MKNLLMTLPLLLAPACGTPGMVPIESYVVRSVDRVVERHDVYVQSDQALSAEARGVALDQSASALVLMGMPEVPAELLTATLNPVMDRHDAYVGADPDLEALEVSIYLGSTERLRSLLEAAAE